MKNLVYLILALALLSCSRVSETRRGDNRHAMYYWSTTFSLDSTKLAFMERHDIQRLYVRYFDVVMRDGVPMPNATIRFDSVVAVPCEVVPVVYIHNDCMKGISNESLQELARNLVTRIRQMNETHDLGVISEMQFDCDWTQSTRDNFFRLIDYIGAEAAQHNIEISATIRLHQLSQPAPKVSRGTLMVYNTGVLTDIDDSKPILDREVVATYIRYIDNYPLPLTTAYPIYRWELLFRNGRFVDILHYDDELPVLDTDSIVVRSVDADEIVACKRLIEEHRPGCRDEVILFDMNNYNLSRYDDKEFKAFFD